MRRVLRGKICARTGVFLFGVVLSATPVAAAVGGINAGRGGGRVTVNDPNAPYVGPGSATTPALPGSAEITGTVRRVDGTAATDIEVRFERAVDGRVETIRTKENGAYSIKLADGIWTGVACDSTLGYQPALWQFTVTDGQILRFREVARAAPSITKAEIALSSDKGGVRTGDEVTLTGAGFRCSGNVVVEVDGMEPATQTAFTTHDDGRVAFRFPSMYPATTGDHVIIRGVRFTYVQGPNRSNVARYRAPVTAIDIDSLAPPLIGPRGGGGGAAPATGSSGSKQRSRTNLRFRK